jgi:integrase
MVRELTHLQKQKQIREDDLKLQKQIAETTVPTIIPTGKRGLGLQVRFGADGKKFTSWLYRYQIGDKRRSLGLGQYPKKSMEKAKAEAEEKEALVDAGVDPHAHSAEEAASKKAEEARKVTFKASAEAYIEAHRAGWRNAKHAWQWTRTLEMFAFPKIGAKAVGDITTADVLEVLTPIWTKKPETAVRVRNRIELVLDAATAQGHRDPLANPARWRGHLDKLLPKRSKVQKVRHQPALAWQEMPAFWEKLIVHQDTVARAMQLTILTASRTSEVLNAQWSEFDLEARLWRVPGDRMKAGRDHTVPLSDAACAILQSQIGADDGLVFPGRKKARQIRPLSNMAMLMRVRRIHPGITMHGFRSTFRDWAAEETHYPRDVAEMALAHVISDATEAAYRRGDLLEKRRALMADWAAFVTTKPGGNVVQLPRREVAS